jgi:hypothetical protein
MLPAGCGDQIDGATAVVLQARHADDVRVESGDGGATVACSMGQIRAFSDPG